MRIQIAHTFDCSPERFWTLILDEDFNERLFRTLEMKERAVLERHEDDERLRRRIRYVPKQDMPAVVKKLLTGDLAYVEETTYNKRESTMDVTVVPNLMADKITFKGIMRVRAAGENRCEREFDADVTVRVMMVGGTIEKTIAETIKKSYDVAAVEIRKELAAGK